ncbi:MAG: hypothetical protein AB2693_13935 [Candidatus Thiodiazotropha sp.]
MAPASIGRIPRDLGVGREPHPTGAIPIAPIHPGRWEARDPGGTTSSPIATTAMTGITIHQDRRADLGPIGNPPGPRGGPGVSPNSRYR